MKICSKSAVKRILDMERVWYRTHLKMPWPRRCHRQEVKSRCRAARLRMPCIRYGWREPIWVIYRLPKVIHAGSVWERNFSHGREHLFNLYAISALVLLRSTFRVMEHLRGNDGPLLRSDVYLYRFDAVSMLLVTLLSTCICPNRDHERYETAR